MKILNFLLPIAFFISLPTNAATIKVINNDTPIQNISSVKIVYTGQVNQEKIASLAAIVDEINQRYTSAHAIYLYISSSGGDMDSGNIGYQIIKNSAIPITTINVSTVQSSATMIYCGAQNRLMMDNTTFLLHAPKVETGPTKDVSEDMIAGDHDWSTIYRAMLKNIYKTCTTLSDEAIDKMTYSEGNHMFLNNAQALNIKIATGEEKVMPPAQAAYYIYDAANH